MTHRLYHRLCFILIFSIINIIRAYYPEEIEAKRGLNHISDTKFDYTDYKDVLEDENERPPQYSSWEPVTQKITFSNRFDTMPEETTNSYAKEGLDPNIVWDKSWGSKLRLGQVSAVSIDPDGHVALLHRGSRVWDSGTFDPENRFNLEDSKGPVRENTIVLLDKTGMPILRWGRDMFFMPHGLTIDHLGNYWITDVAMHQVFKFDAKDIREKKALLMRDWTFDINLGISVDNKDPFKTSAIKPSLVLGKAFIPGNDEECFCKPTAVAVMKNGDFFVSDGYCNSRIIKFNAKGERILTWGRNWQPQDALNNNFPPNAFLVPHALALAENLGYIFVADREHGRVLCYYSSNGTFHREYKDKVMGSKIYGIAYAKEKLYLINGPDEVNIDLHIRGFIMDINTGKILSQFGLDREMSRPHDIAVTPDGREIYVAELDSRRISRFLTDKNISSVKPVSSDLKASRTPVPDLEFEPESDVGVKETSAPPSTLAFTLIVSMIVLIVLCLILAAVVSRCRKRGCLLMSRRRKEWKLERKERFKLSSLMERKNGSKFKFFEKRPNTRDFSKLNTEPETSDDEHPEDSFTKII